MLDHRLKETVDNGKNGSIQESGFDAKTLESTLAAKTLESPLPPPKSQLQPTSFLQRLRQGWDNLSFRTKLSILLLGSAALPVIAVTQGLVALNTDNLLNDLKASLQKDGNAFTEDYVLWTQAEAQAQAQNLAKLVQSTEIDLSNPAQVSARRALLQNFLGFDNGLDSEVNKNFQIFTDAQGRTVAQDVKILAQGSYNSPPLQALDKALTAPKYSPVSLPTGISLGDIPIVKNSLRTGRPLSGMELLKPQPLQRLGLAKQADIGLRKQPTQNLPESKQPFPEGTYDINEGQAGLTSMAVYPIKINNKLVGTAIVGALQNGNYGLVDKFSQKYNVPVATVFAKDWRVSTNVPYIDGQTRAIGTRVAREVAETVLNQKQDFSGQTNIVGQQYLTFYTPVYDHEKELNPSSAKPVGMAFVGESLLEVESSLRQQQLIAYGIGGGMLLLVGLVTIPIAGSFARPLRRLVGFAQQVGAGEQGVRLGTTERQDEIGVLSKELNQMAISIDASLIAQRQEAERAQLLKDIIVRISQSVSVNDVFNKAVQEIRLALKTDRVVVYSFNKKWQGTVIAESVADEWPRALGAQIDDPCFADRYVERYRQGRVQPTANIYEAGLNDCHIKQLEQFAVKANLVAPILQGNQLLGLLIAHQCDRPRAWQQSEIDLFAQLASQVGFTLDRTNLIEQQRAGKEQLQKRALELLVEVDPVSRGDLTIRASVTEDEIGTVAGAYNATISSLRKIVTQVQAAALQVTTTTSSSEASAQELSAEAFRQAEEISAALDQLQEMSKSIRAVATNAEQAEAAVQQATQTVKVGDAAMNRTVEGILAIRETVAETSKKVKRLGESSQKISKVVNLIGTFADQTNLLALNASIEAAHAGEQGRGFAVVADRVRALARQSAQATAEIESLVKDIQTETNEVVAAMEAGTEQVVSGTKLVDETRQSLNQITAVSTQISTLVEAIAQASVAQSQASESVTQTMSDVAMSAAHTSTEATEVSASFKELLAVAQELQASASQFKVS